MSKNELKLNQALDRYYDKFGKDFPLMQAYGDDDNIISQINKCIDKGKPIEKIWPEQYGACYGKNF